MLHENQHYLKGHMVEDPIAKIQFPKYAAGAKIEKDGKTVYFVDESTRDEYVSARAAGDKLELGSLTFEFLREILCFAQSAVARVLVFVIAAASPGRCQQGDRPGSPRPSRPR